MSIHSEKVRAIRMAREFLFSLLDRRKTKGVPKKIRKEAYWVLKHYPMDYDVTVRQDFYSIGTIKDEFLVTIGRIRDEEIYVDDLLRFIEVAIYNRFLELSEHSTTKAAPKLGIARTTFLMRLKKLRSKGFHFLTK